MNLRPIILYFLLQAVLSPEFCQAQTNIDSLKKVSRREMHDTLKVRTDIRLGQAYENVDFDSALFYYNRALRLSEEKPMRGHPYYRGLVLDNMGFAYIYGKGQTFEGIHYLKKALDNHRSEGLKAAANKTEYNIGFFYGNSSVYDSALFHYNEVIDRNEELSTMVRLHESYNNAGLTYFYKGEYALSAKYLTEGIRLKEQTGETKEIHHGYANLGITFLNLGEWERAKSYYNKAMVTFVKMGNKDAMANTYRSLTEVLIKQDSLQEAERALQKAFELNRETGNQIGLSMDHNYMGSFFERRGDYRKALENYEEARKIFTGEMNDRYAASVLTSLGRMKLKLLNESQVLSSENKAVLIMEIVDLGKEAWMRASRSDLINRKLSSAELLKSVYAIRGNYKLSLEFADTAFALTNIINGQAQSQAIAFATTEYETEKVENENALLLQTQKAQVARLKQQDFVIYSVIIVLILILTIGTIIYQSRLKLKKANQVIEKSLSEKELLLKEIHHRVKNNLQVVSSLLDLQSRGIEDEEALATFMEGQNRVKAMALIHQKLYQNENLATINFEEYAGLLMAELGAIYQRDRKVKTEVKASGVAEFDIDIAVPLGLILNELISNAYKYAFTDNGSGKLSVSLEKVGDDQHQLIVADNGKGLPSDFDVKKAKSLGLRLVRRLAKQLYGSVTYSGDRGARFVVIFTGRIERKTA